MTNKKEIISCLFPKCCLATIPTICHNKCSMNLHCAKSYMPFELFANENHKLQNEAKMNVTFERGSDRDPWRSPLSAELNDASTWRIGVPVLQFVVTLLTTTASWQSWKSCSGCNSQKTQPLRHVDQRLLTMVRCCSEQASLLLQRAGLVAQPVPCAEKRSFREWVTTLWVPHEDVLCVANCRQIRALHSPPWQRSTGEAKHACRRLGTWDW